MAVLSGIVTGQVTASTAAAQISSGGGAAVSGILVKALGANSTSNIYIGGSSALTATNGFELSAGASQLFPINNIDELWVISAAGTPKISYVVI